MIPLLSFKTTNSSTNESLMPVMEYLYPSYSALNTEHCRIYQQNYENLQLTVTVVITNLGFLVDYSCEDYKFMLAVT